MAAWQKFCCQNMRGRQIMIDRVRYLVITHLRGGVWKLRAQRTGGERVAQLDWFGRHVRDGGRSRRRDVIVETLEKQQPLDATQIAAAMNVTPGAVGLLLSCMALEGALTWRTIKGRRCYALDPKFFAEFDRQRQQDIADTKEWNQWQDGARSLRQLKRHLRASHSPRRGFIPEPTSRA